MKLALDQARADYAVKCGRHDEIKVCIQQHEQTMAHLRRVIVTLSDLLGEPHDFTEEKQ
jgi:hypothetical protein